MACLVRYVATSGNDSGTGCDASAPLLTIGGCISRLAPPAPPSWPPRYAAGGTCLVSPGTYHEGTADTAYGSTLVNSVNDLTIALAPESAWPAGTTATEVTIDGTMELTGWEAKSDAHGVYYRSTAAYGDTVWQLFVDGAPLTAARWPNADAWSDDAWSRARGWASQAAGSSCGVSVDKGTAEPAEGEAGHQSLAATGVSFNGCNVIMNNEHWITRRYTVANHAAGTGTFDYETDSSNSLCTRYGSDIAGSRYFIDGCVAAFDAPGEWVRDAEGHLLVRLPTALAAGGIGEVTVLGKMQTYAFAFRYCDRLTLDGLSFFATTVMAFNSRRATIRRCNFRYPSASRRALGGDVAEFNAVTAGYADPGAVGQGLVGGTTGEQYEVIVPSTGIWAQQWKWGNTMLTAARFEDNSVYFSEGAAFTCTYCYNDTIANNDIAHAGYPFARALYFYGSRTHYMTVRRNRIAYSGSGAVGMLWGQYNIAELNRISQSGLTVIDTEAINGGGPTSYAQFRFNWVHDTSGFGLRYDAGEDGGFGVHNDLLFNVLVRNGVGAGAKANNATNYRNTAIANWGEDLKIFRCYPASCRTTSGGDASTNIGSRLHGNVGSMGPGTSGGLNNPYDVGELGPKSHNINLALNEHSYGATAEAERRALFRDFDNYDFRPRAGGPLIDAGFEIEGIEGAPAIVGAAADIGAYEAGSPTYWIPGPQRAAASSPIPPAGATGVVPDADLMFLPGREAASHRIYLGEAGDALALAAGELSGDANVFTPARYLRPGLSYKWRVDAVGADGAVVAGDEWGFAVGCGDDEALCEAVAPASPPPPRSPPDAANSIVSEPAQCSVIRPRTVPDEWECTCCQFRTCDDPFDALCEQKRCCYPPDFRGVARELCEC